MYVPTEVHLIVGKKIVFGIEEYFDGIRYHDVSPKKSGHGYNVSIYRSFWYRMIWDMISRHIATYHATSHRITSKHQVNTNSTKTHHLVAVYSCFFSALSLPHLGLSSVWHFLSSFCCPSAGHIIGLTIPPPNSNLVPSRLGLLPERMLFCFIFRFFFLFFLSVSFPSWYLVPGTR